MTAFHTDLPAPETWPEHIEDTMDELTEKILQLVSLRNDIAYMSGEINEWKSKARRLEGEIYEMSRARGIDRDTLNTMVADAEDDT